MKLTDSIDLDVNLGAHDLVPAEDGEDMAAVAVDGAEGVSEGCIWREVVFQCLLLQARRAGREFVDD